MKISVEISYYPLNNEYRAPIKKFIDSLSKQEGVVVQPTSMSTRVFGDYGAVMQAVTKCMEEAFELPSSTFVLKVMNMDRNK